MSLITSYYIGYMLCIFSVLYFFAYYFGSDREDRGEFLESKHFVKSVLRFALYSVVSGLLASPVLLPAAYALGFGKSEFSNPKFSTTSSLL